MGAYHPGSLAVQERVGVRHLAEHVGRSVGTGIRPVAAAFLEARPMLVIGAADEAGRVWASLLTGAPGFVRATGPDTVSVAGGVPAHDPLAGAITPAGTPVGTLALDPGTRRRMRLNGTARPSRRGFTVTADRVFSNCPKYLQKRERYDSEPAGPGPGTPHHGETLTPAQAARVRAADTFFVATAAPDGVDASHRGGNPGFVRVDGPRELSWRDYPGNAMFLTLGNLESDGRAGLLFPDWETGTTLQLTGLAHTEYGPEERVVRFRADHVVETPGASPLRWSPPEYSPANPATP
ncbi:MULTISPECIES: pyridoxamine 5'-phosphate oxidase family protein [unclassified Streptomyces]|uniref:pyridoxamine 5'-phosphate oxidase family protein n=1 Tax=unclassified Streptomyces TaxID=2593676 RepID=UPI0006AEA3E8|nr:MULTISPECIES: pyridoxamine 5'-phosphate oxidase family protein [unclassified Streptomyces]KOX27872.1 pyridoxamine 5-phosphate oxidase [Streptomyces sp. NRRL F-6491]KOX38247.1 pyridoxamine 5-phosphate oxidase [Streptomyces sp. NRRL F-6492]